MTRLHSEILIYNITPKKTEGEEWDLVEITAKES